jgi:putative nucleotidyltransferase with HDIG domain
VNDSLRLFVQKITKLPTIPVIAHELLSLGETDAVSVDKLEEIVSKDPVIAAKIVGLSNAAFFGYKMTDTTISGAIQKIGFTNVKNVALGIALMTIFDNKHNKYASDYCRIYKHCIATGIVAVHLATNLKITACGDLFLCGMLHDIGLLLLNSYFPDLYFKTAEMSREHKNLIEAEIMVLEFTHADIGAWVADTWHLPDAVHEVILHHHTPSIAGKYKQNAALIHLADYITCKRFFCMVEQNSHCPVDPLTLFLLGMPEKNFDDIQSGLPDNLFEDGIFGP